MSDFDVAFEKVVSIEGGYVNDPQDPGGETKYGISKRAYPDEDIQNLTLQRAKALYRSDYWDSIKGDLLPYPLNLFMFDAAVNQGVDPAIQMLQKTLGLKVDGVFGVKTLSAAREMKDSAIGLYLAERAMRYVGTKNADKYLHGWLNRLFKLAVEV